MTLPDTTQSCPYSPHLGPVGCLPAPNIFPFAKETFAKGKMFWNPKFSVVPPPQFRVENPFTWTSLLPPPLLWLSMHPLHMLILNTYTSNFTSVIGSLYSNHLFINHPPHPQFCQISTPLYNGSRISLII